jgi:hypothetical protein
MRSPNAHHCELSKNTLIREERMHEFNAKYPGQIDGVLKLRAWVYWVDAYLRTDLRPLLHIVSPLLFLLLRSDTLQFGACRVRRQQSEQEPRGMVAFPVH